MDKASEELKKLLYSFLSSLEYSITIELEKPNKVKGITNITKMLYSDRTPFCAGEITLVRKGIIANIIPLLIKDAVV